MDELGGCEAVQRLEPPGVITGIHEKLEVRPELVVGVVVVALGRVHPRVHQQTLRVDQDVALLAFDLPAGVNAVRVRAPPFSALLTLWLSMMPTVGLASRPACSRHCR